MSIYTGWKPLTSDVQAQSPRADTDTTQEHAPPPAQVAAQAQKRRGQPANVLLPRTREWIESLPSEVRPKALHVRYARIANLMCSTWETPKEARQYFDDLLVDRRGGRQGFAPDVLQDIKTLSEYFEAVQAQRGKHWTLVEYTR